MVVLTSGPFNETYFEHSYLAKYWGATLVGGDDLTVRDGRVYLKTVAGLNQVDVIVRRLDDDFCDPLELRGDSLLGKKLMYEVYLQATPNFTGRVTVPVLWDKQTGSIVNNESADILRMLRADFDRHGPVRGVMHSFTGDAATAEAFLAIGLHISFAGMVKRHASVRRPTQSSRLSSRSSE